MARSKLRRRRLFRQQLRCRVFLNGIRGGDGVVRADPTEAGGKLAIYWGGVFSATQVDRS
eukprot:3399665-Pyramimonas_sp.AAC.1